MKVKGSILLKTTECQHCSHPVFSASEAMPKNTICKKCGAKYEIVEVKTLCGEKDNDIEVEYNFEDFNCLELGFFNSCKNTCPAPYMFCKGHSSDAFIDNIKTQISKAGTRVIELKDKLELIQKSKKNWMVTELSGIKNE